MSARDEIMARVRAGVGKDDFAQRLAQAEAALRRPALGPQPHLAPSLLDLFVTRAEAQASTVARIGSRAQVPSAVASYLAGLDLPAETAR